MKRLFVFLLGCTLCWALAAQSRICENFDKGWEFAYGHAADPARALHGDCDVAGSEGEREGGGGFIG